MATEKQLVHWKLYYNNNNNKENCVLRGDTCSASNFKYQQLNISTWQRELRKEIVFPVRCGRTWLTCTEPRPHMLIRHFWGMKCNSSCEPGRYHPESVLDPADAFVGEKSLLLTVGDHRLLIVFNFCLYWIYFEQLMKLNLFFFTKCGEDILTSVYGLCVYILLLNIL